jgi:hypothetical protein
LELTLQLLIKYYNRRILNAPYEKAVATFDKIYIMLLIGYSGHSFVVYDIFKNAGIAITGYCDSEEKFFNAFQLKYFGKETSAEAIEKIKTDGYLLG